MAEQVFRAPGYYDNEIDASAKVAQPSGTPSAVIGASAKGPAFVPVTVGSFSDFQTKFGNLDPKLAAPYAVQKWLDNRSACTFVRVLGAGANSTTTDFTNTLATGEVKNAGFKITGSAVGGTDHRYQGSTQFIVAQHVVTGTEIFGIPMFSDNASFFTTGSLPRTQVYLVRGMLFSAYDTRIMAMASSDTFTGLLDDFASLDSTSTDLMYNKFKLVISCSQGSAFATTDGIPGVKILTASLNPSDSSYIANILNTDPDKFGTERHLLYCDFAVDDEIASVPNASNFIGIVSGSSATTATGGDTTTTFRDLYGRFDTRYTTPKTTWFISQPFSQKEYKLFYVEGLDDGAFANSKYKISIQNIKASSDPKNLFGTFSLVVRDFSDTDIEPKVYEQFNNLTLNPEDNNYVAKVIGDIKSVYMFDSFDPDDRRLMKSGTNPNKSKYVRVVMNEQVARKMIPADALPFGFEGFQFLNTNSLMTDSTSSVLPARLAASGSGDITTAGRLTSAILPPMPYRFKVTRGEVSTAASPPFQGFPGSNEITDARFYWGVKPERNTYVINPNISNEQNNLIAALTKFQGISKLDVLYTGSIDVNQFCSNKFTLARVCLSNTSLTAVTASAAVHMREAAYIRNGIVSPSNYTVADGALNRISFATLLMDGSSASVFNQFSDYAKFTTVMYGGYDGTNILDSNASRFNDVSTSTETAGGSNTSFLSPGFGVNQCGVGSLNSTIFSYQTAVKIITDPLLSQHNILAIPGIREPYVTDDATLKTEAHSLSLYVMDLPYYDFNGNRIFDGDVGKFIDVLTTSDNFETRAIDNNYSTTYFPNITIDDTMNNRKVTVPASVGALAALGYNDRISYPWFAPAGFNRGALSFVSLTQVKINQAERDRLTEVRINPIVRFPNNGFVIMAQNTLQQAKTALTSINVKRMLLEVKRSVVDIGNRALFGNITPQTLSNLQKQFSSVLASVQTKGGIDKFIVICDSSNNTTVDANSNQANVRIKIVPTRAIEYISIDFVVSQSGVTFL